VLYLLYGPDEFTRSEALAAFRAELPADLLHLNSARLDGRNLKLNDLMVACEAVPFLADHRLVIVVDALKHLKAGKARDELRTFLEQVPPSCKLVFLEQDDFDKRSSLYTYLKKHGQVQEFVPRQGADLLRWLGEQANARGVRMARSPAQHLVDYVGNDSRTLMTELDKLASYVGQGMEITEESITRLVQDSHEANLFAFLDSLSQRQRGAAIQQLHELLREGQAIAYIVFMLARQVRVLLNVKELATQRMRTDAIASQLRQKPFVIKKALQQVQAFSTSELETLHHRLLALDHAIKTGKINAPAALDLLVLDVCG
jgi:DNA polymerase III subunit delta